MYFSDLCKQRCSIREYSDKPVEREKIESILEAGRMAPSAVNYQPWTFLVLRDAESREKIQECYHREWFKSAPCYIVMFIDHNLSWKRKVDGKDFGDVDVALATDHMTLQATDLGLGSCWVCNFDPQTLKSNFNVPEHLEPLVILPIGYPSEDIINNPALKIRKSLNESVKWEKL